MVRINLGRLAPALHRVQPAYFQPSFGTSCASIQATGASATQPASAATTSTASLRRCSFSSSAGGSNSRTGPRQRSKAPATATPSTAAAAAARSDASSATQRASPATAHPTPLAPRLPHATASLVGLDSFFAIHRPLLELPIRLNQRKTTGASSGRLVNHSAMEIEDMHEEMELKQGESDHGVVGIGPEEIAEVVDLAEDGTPTGASYRVMLGGTPKMEPLRSPEEEREIEAQQEADAAEEHEAVMAELEEDHPDPYDAWLVGEPEGPPHPPAVARYLASHPPFMPPPFPRKSRPASKTAEPPASASELPPQAQADLTYLRPHSAKATASDERSPYASVFASQLANPLDPNTAKQQVDRLLSAASLTHRWHAQRDYDTKVTEPLELAQERYAGREGGVKEGKEGTVRLWSDKDGWVTINLKRDSMTGPFLPAELVDLSWVGERDGAIRNLGEIALDSTKRKRKKKMTKHKYKKRRKAQRALRQRLGK